MALTKTQKVGIGIGGGLVAWLLLYGASRGGPATKKGRSFYLPGDLIEAMQLSMVQVRLPAGDYVSSSDQVPIRIQQDIGNSTYVTVQPLAQPLDYNVDLAFVDQNNPDRAYKVRLIARRPKL